MYLEKIELFGFKSFAQKTILKFTPEITCIVGPNGSGKSNIVDSIRWVTGEQSLKILRGKKSEDIIFSGSNKKPRSNLAEVSLYLNNEGNKKLNDYPSTIVLSRRLFRNGENEYLLNKQKVRLQDIVLLLAQINLGQKSYGIVSQGMTDYILFCSPKERKNFFDEAVGVKHYQIKKEKALNQLKRALVNLKQGELMLAEIKPRLRSLTRQVNRLKRREEIEKNLKELEKKYYGFFWRKVEKEYNKEKEREKEISQKYQNQLEKVNKLKKQLNQIMSEEEKGGELSNLQNEYEKVLKIKNELISQQALLKGKILIEKEKLSQERKEKEINFNQDDLKRLINFLKEIDLDQGKIIEIIEKTNSIKELKAIKNKIENIQEKIRNFLSKIQKNEYSPTFDDKILKKLEKENQIIIQKLENIEKEVQKIKEKINQYTQRETTKRKQIFELQKNYQKAQNLLDILNNELNEIKINISRIETKKEDLKNEITKRIGDINLIKETTEEEIIPEELEEKINKLRYQIEIIGGIDPETVKEYEETKSRFDFLSNQIDDLKKTITSLNKLIKELDEKIKNQFNQALKEINQQFDKYFKLIFGGGKAQLILREETIAQKENDTNVDEKETNSEKEETKPSSLEIAKDKETFSGLEVSASLPRKKIKSIHAFSGGEKALTSLALICSIIAYNPPPFVILDEADAALDEANSQKFVSILEQLSQKTQFIIITHNRVTMEKAKILYGVTMDEEGTSKILSLNLVEAEKVAKK